MKEIENLVKRLSAKKEVKAIILFGSQATGRAHSESDIDLAVLTDKISRDKELEIMNFSNEKIQISIFDKLPLVIQFRVVKEGKVLFCADERFLVGERAKVMRNYLDFAPILRRILLKKIWNTT